MRLLCEVQRDGPAGHGDPGAELLCLHLGPLGQRLAGHPGGEAEVVLDARARARLPAGGLALQHDRAQPLRRGVDGGGQPGGADADHGDVDHLRGVELLGDAEAVRQFGDAGPDECVVRPAEGDGRVVGVEAGRVEACIGLGVRAGFQRVDRVPAASSSTRPNSATRATCSSLSVGNVSSVRA